MTIASLTGLGPATGPEVVKAEGERAAAPISIAEADLKIEGLDLVDGKVIGAGYERIPTAIVLTIPNAGAGIDEGSIGSENVTITTSGAIEIRVPQRYFGGTSPDGVKVDFSRINLWTDETILFSTSYYDYFFYDGGDIDIIVTANGTKFTGTLTDSFNIGVGQLEGEVKLSGNMTVGQTITATSKNNAPHLSPAYRFIAVKDGAEDRVLQEGLKDTYILTSAEVGCKIKVESYVGWHGGILTCISEEVVKAASSGGSTGGGSTGGGSTSTPSTPSTDNNTTTETKPDGTKVETATETKPDGSKVETTTETKPDGSATTTVKETETNASGREVAVTTTIQKDAFGNVTAEMTTSVIANADKGTSATVTVVKDSAGNQTAAAEVTKAGTKTSSGKTKGTISSSVVRQITEAAGTNDVTITQAVTNADGSTKFTVEVNAKDLVSGEVLKIMKLDPKTGDYVLCNATDYAVSAAGGISLSIKTEGEFILVNEKDAKAASDAILKTVKVKNSSTTVKAGESTKISMSSSLNMKNVSKITYTVSDKSTATVSKDGKVKAKKSGTVTVKAKVTLKNGQTKTVKMTVKIK